MLDIGNLFDLAFREGNNLDYGAKENEVELMQFTGLLDKNGKEIYEGELVRFEMGNTKYVGKVIWGSFGDSEYATTGFHVEYGTYTDEYIGLYEGEDFEILGNIYKNPELLRV